MENAFIQSTGSFPRKRESLFTMGDVNLETEIPAFAGMTPWMEGSSEGDIQ